MKAIFNNEIIDWDTIQLSKHNRGFMYGDGLFETIAVVKGIPRFLNQHLNRLRNGAKKLKLNVADQLNEAHILKNIQVLQQKNNLLSDAKIKIIIWRDSLGLYTPSDGNMHHLITLEDCVIQKKILIKSAGFSSEVINFPTSISKYKTMSALKYVLAGIEKKEKNLDEIIILDNNSFISETLSSNLFWRKGDTYFTPALSTGCIEGIMRNWLIEKLQNKGYEIKEKRSKSAEMLAADHIFTTNATGIRHIQKIEGYTFAVDGVTQEIYESIS